MSSQSSASSHSALSCTDGIATGMSDAWMLVSRVLMASVLLMTAWPGSPNPGFLNSLGLPNPAFWSFVAIAVEVIVSISLILGVGIRYGALLGILYVIIATALAHRYWAYPQAQQGAQYTNFLKNLAIIGGLLAVFVNGGGRYSIDAMLSGKR